MEEYKEAIPPIDQANRNTSRNPSLAKKLPQLNLARRMFNQIFTDSEPLALLGYTEEEIEIFNPTASLIQQKGYVGFPADWMVFLAEYTGKGIQFANIYSNREEVSELVLYRRTLQLQQSALEPLSFNRIRLYLLKAEPELIGDVNLVARLIHASEQSNISNRMVPVENLSTTSSRERWGLMKKMGRGVPFIARWDPNVPPDQLAVGIKKSGQEKFELWRQVALMVDDQSDQAFLAYGRVPHIPKEDIKQILGS